MNPLLSLLEQNARTPVESIAKQLSLPVEEVQAQLQRLEEDGVVLAYKPVVNDEKARPNLVKAVIEVRITPEGGGGFDRLAQRIAQHSVVTSCFLMSGSYDLLVFVEGTTASISQFVSEKLSTIPGVLSTATHFMLKPYKVQGVLLQATPSPERLVISP